MSIYQEALGIKDTIVAHRRYLHQIPELGLELPKTAAYVEEQLQKMGYETKRIGDCGIVALAGKKEGKCFMIRADMDALPISKREKALSFARAMTALEGLPARETTEENLQLWAKGEKSFADFYLPALQDYHVMEVF